MNRQSGFTLIELIIVIVILGILAVTAAPQFFNFGSDARTSTVRGMEGSVRAASELVFSRSAINGTERDEDASVEVSGETVNTAYGYPTAESLVDALNVSDGDWTFQPVDGSDPAQVAIFPQGRSYTETQAEACQVLYSEVTAPDTRPVIVAQTEGC